MPAPLPSRLLMTSIALLIAGCAPAVLSQPTRLEPLTASVADLQLRTAVKFKLPTGYSRVLSPQTRWHPVGKVAAGTVYRPVGTVFSIEGRNVHEAYLVLDQSGLVGFYLPGESRFASLDSAVPLPISTPQ